MHFAPGQSRKASFLKDLANLKPDLIVNTGDNLGHKNAINPLLSALEPLLEYPGVFVNGSNDYFSPKLGNPLKYLLGPSSVEERFQDLDTKRMVTEFENAGWLNLNNQIGSITINAQKYNFAGVDDPHLSRESPRPAPAQNLIALTHSPYQRVLDEFVNLKAKLIFAGHTHGGQICLPGGRALNTNCDLPASQAQGLSYYKQTPLHVAGGIGASIFTPVRLFCPPSATLIEIRN
jgi:predicted MPP superfamily phosphohydrolase